MTIIKLDKDQDRERCYCEIDLDCAISEDELREGIAIYNEQFHTDLKVTDYRSARPVNPFWQYTLGGDKSDLQDYMKIIELSTELFHLYPELI